MSNKNNVSAAKPKIGGAVSVAPAGSTLPTSAEETLDAEFKNLGYISDDGLSQSITRENSENTAWGGDSVLDSQTKYGEEFGFKLLEVLNPDVMKVVFGDNNVTGTALSTGISVDHTAEELPEKAWVIDRILNGNTIMRTVIPSAKLSEIGEIAFKDSDTIGYDVKIKAHPDSNGKYCKDYYKTATAPGGNGGSSQGA